MLKFSASFLLLLASLFMGACGQKSTEPAPNTPSLIAEKVAGQYYFEKGVEYSFQMNGPGTTTRLRATTLTILRLDQSISLANSTDKTLEGNTLTLESSQLDWPTASRFPNYRFRQGTSSNYAFLYAQQQGDSAIIQMRSGGVGGGITRTYYGKKIR